RTADPRHTQHTERLVGIIHRATPTTRFPYTTLFRSPGRWVTDRTCDPRCPHASSVTDRRLWPHERTGTARTAGLARLRALAVKEDRKSTRLNSSHVKISYAVFCWKKKTSQTTNIRKL